MSTPTAALPLAPELAMPASQPSRAAVAKGMVPLAGRAGGENDVRGAAQLQDFAALLATAVGGHPAPTTCDAGAAAGGAAPGEGAGAMLGRAPTQPGADTTHEGAVSVALRGAAFPAASCEGDDEFPVHATESTEDEKRDPPSPDASSSPAPVRLPLAAPVAHDIAQSYQLAPVRVAEDVAGMHDLVPLPACEPTPRTGEDSRATRATHAATAAFEGRDPGVRAALEHTIDCLTSEGHAVRVVETVRVPEREGALRQAERTIPEEVVTWARGARGALEAREARQASGRAAEPEADGRRDGSGNARLPQVARQGAPHSVGVLGDSLPRPHQLPAEMQEALPAIAPAVRPREESQSAVPPILEADERESPLANEGRDAGHVSSGSRAMEWAVATSPRLEPVAGAVRREAPTAVTLLTHRIEQLLAEREQLRMQPLTQVTLAIDAANGTTDRIQVGLAGRTLDAVIRTDDEHAAKRMTRDIAGLSEALVRTGVESTAVSVHEVSAGAKVGALDTARSAAPPPPDGGEPRRPGRDPDQQQRQDGAPSRQQGEAHDHPHRRRRQPRAERPAPAEFPLPT